VQATETLQELYADSDQERKNELELPYNYYFVDEQKAPTYDDLSITGSNITAHQNIGYNGNAKDNLAWNNSEGWFAYSTANRLIIERISDKT
jgi:hypothetical protein